jgi:hypothetical protein
MKRSRRRHPSRFALLLVAACVVLSTVAASAFATRTTGALRSPDAGSASCLAGSKPAIIGGQFKCLRVGQACKGRYEKAYRKYRLTCAYSHLHRWSPPPPPPVEPVPPPPPLPPSAQPGHYKGLTSQITTFEFDIVNGGLLFRGLNTGQINQGCTPSGHVYGGNLNWPDYIVPVSLAGVFTIDTDLTGGTIGGWPTRGHLTIRGQMAGQTGSGSLEVRDMFTNTSNGVTYSCGSGLQTWTATRTG